MEKYAQVRKRLIIGLIVLSLSMTLVPIVGSLSIEKEKPMMMNCSDGIVISGTMGENGCYISSVLITLNFTNWYYHIYYQIDDGGCCEYMVPIIVDTDGEHTVWVSCFDQEGNVEAVFNATFKIDKTLPDITLTKETLGLGQIKFVANVSDAMSGVWRVEFYIDDEPVFTDFDFPFESPWVWSGKHNVVATVFDFAGNSQIDCMSTPYVLGNIGMSLNPSEISITTSNHFRKSLYEKECLPLRENITVTFTYPENGIYWNDRKIMSYSVPFILHGNGDLVFHGFRFYRDTPVEYTITGPIVLVEFYSDGVLIGTVTTPPYEFSLPTQMTSFSHINLKIIAYGANQGDWDEITIWRLFI